MAGIFAIKIENFDSNGVYFQHKGDLWIQNETLNFAHAIDSSILENSIVSLGAKLDAEVSRNISDRKAIADIYSQISSKWSFIKTVFSESINNDFKFIGNERKVELTSLKNKVTKITAIVNNLKINDTQIFERLNAIDTSMNFLSQCAGSKEVTLDILQNQFIEGIRHFNRSLLSVTHHRQDHLIIFSVKVPIYNEQEFDLYKVINLPIIKNKNIVTLKNDFNYLIVSKSKDIYFSVKEDLSELHKRNGVLIYDDVYKHLKYSLSNSPCLYNMLEGVSLDSCVFRSNFTNIEIFERLEQNKFLFAIRDDTPYTYSCGTINNYGKKDFIQGTGFLYLDSFCDFRTNDSRLRTTKLDAVLKTKDKYDLNMKDFLNKTLKSYIKPIPEVLPMKKISTNFDQLTKLFIQMEDLLKKHDQMLKNLIEFLPTNDPEN